MLSIPDMMFAPGEEPVGVRVSTYRSSKKAINSILDALDRDEVQIIRESPFGRVVEVGEETTFSGAFAGYVLSRQLKVNKRYEAWFLFAGKPIRFSLREFAIVTGLPCGGFPPKKSKKTITEKPFWPCIFGKREVLSVSTAVKMLRRNRVKDIRIKLACLVIVSSVLLPTNSKMNILKEHAEFIEDLDEFFAFPWGRLAFEMLICSIKKKDEISLSQKNVFMKGFALALHLVMVEAVPSLIKNEKVSHEWYIDEDVSDSPTKIINPMHARSLDKSSDVFVKSIIDADPLRPVDESTLVWSDEVVDPRVDNLVGLINQDYVFSKEMFKGGATKVDVGRMQEEAKAGARENKTKKPSTNPPPVESYFASIIIDNTKPEVQRIKMNAAAALSSEEQDERRYDDDGFLIIRPPPLVEMFGMEEPHAPPVLSESQIEEDKMWEEMEFCIKSDEVDLQLHSEVEKEISANESLGAGCRKGNHKLCLDLEIGMKCIHCSFVMREIRDMDVSEWGERKTNGKRRKVDRSKEEGNSNSIIGNLEFEAPGKSNLKEAVTSRVVICEKA